MILDLRFQTLDFEFWILGILEICFSILCEIEYFFSKERKLSTLASQNLSDQE